MLSCCVSSVAIACVLLLIASRSRPSTVSPGLSLMSTLSGQTFTTLQILGAFASLEISWGYPFRYLVINFGVLGLDMDILRVDCVSAPVSCD